MYSFSTTERRSIRRKVPEAEAAKKWYWKRKYRKQRQRKRGIGRKVPEAEAAEKRTGRESTGGRGSEKAVLEEKVPKAKATVGKDFCRNGE